ncbi:hypothetical protein EMIHUDRAFT_455909 [Emiliania huxleyi CCMP1516]|uniref:Uncharacterized protein n=2 Tax=Emiliania huxleyi TaxID=2903 RepID=A0A0D3KB42_EMIH1|nr:hypothetical protein EMIHUDRAFT_455909 [Emiliania huxleyi CCMP1516]EOD32977.1 hypothetical protein EMIHUDRAFT_455909 [Emiliania huxleyi CCMP1516]|eukprot:XP_005785406.1 hypothetical protein EMIHUDRAFT_455909 [Emiliania huxleyi CCMP1516]
MLASIGSPPACAPEAGQFVAPTAPESGTPWMKLLADHVLYWRARKAWSRQYYNDVFQFIAKRAPDLQQPLRIVEVGTAFGVSALPARLALAVFSTAWLLRAVVTFAALRAARRFQLHDRRLVSHRQAALPDSRFFSAAGASGADEAALLHLCHGFGSNALTWAPLLLLAALLVRGLSASGRFWRREEFWGGA